MCPQPQQAGRAPSLPCKRHPRISPRVTRAGPIPKGLSGLALTESFSATQIVFHFDPGLQTKRVTLQTSCRWITIYGSDFPFGFSESKPPLKKKKAGNGFPPSQFFCFGKKKKKKKKVLGWIIMWNQSGLGWGKLPEKKNTRMFFTERTTLSENCTLLQRRKH